ncbi:MAG TPA: M23 family metallopeptidase [Terriglobia bacterium]|nr:M23 family metallopeptidase [Terriglobia bacterium]
MRTSLVVAIVILLAIILTVGWRVISNPAPIIQFTGHLKGIGAHTPVQIEVRDDRYAIKRVQIELRQDGRSFPVPFMETVFGEPPSTWKFWASPGENSWSIMAHVGRREIPALKEGRATLVVTATNNAWGRFFRGGRSQSTLELPVRFTPPQIEVLSSKHYVNQGGAELVVFNVSSGAAESGVQVGQSYFPSWPVKESLPDTRLCLFAYAYNVDPKTPAHIVARDDAGNETVSPFTYEVFPKKFHSDTINLTDDFLNRVVPAIMSQTPELTDQGSLLKNFLQENGHLREVEAQQLVDFSKKTAPHFLWTQPFIELPSKVEASFADYRTYVYNGQVVDHQTHLGFDLAGLQHMPIQAANDGVVVHAGFFGIYGNAVIIDHGCGLQTLYGHMSSIEVKEGEAVKRGQVIGHSGETGLAGGDHLHFTVLLDGIPVNPTEWWDPHWIHDRIEEKLAAYK